MALRKQEDRQGKNVADNKLLPLHGPYRHKFAASAVYSEPT
jgi:hypothetical protein